MRGIKASWAILAVAGLSAVIVVAIAVYGWRGREVPDSLIMLLSALINVILGWVKVPAVTVKQPAEPPAIDDT